MPFHPAPAPEDSVNALRVAAETLHPAHGQMVAMLRELSTNPQAHQPHKVYTVGLKDMAGDAGLSNKKLLGWRYLAQSRIGMGFNWTEGRIIPALFIFFRYLYLVSENAVEPLPVTPFIVEVAVSV